MSSGPHVRYFDARGPRRWLWPAVAVVAVAVAGVVLALATRGPRGEQGAPPVTTAPAPLTAVSAPAESEVQQTVVEVESEIAFPSVLVVGDSITRGSRGAVRSVLIGRGVDDVEIDAEDGRRIEVGNGTSEPLAGVRAVRRQLAAGADPDAWVVALGTNDIGLYGDAEGYRALVREVLELIPAEAPLLWVDVYRFDQPEATAMFNEVVREELAARGRSSVVSWFDVVSADESLLQVDRLHPDDDGRIAFALLVADGLDGLDGG